MNLNKELIKLIPQGAIRIIEGLWNSGFEAYLVGGCVRDMILGKKPNDFDICTSAEPNEIIKTAQRMHFRITTFGIKFGTIVVIVDGEEFEVTTFRTDTEFSGGHRPISVSFSKKLWNDLSRRDFTVNAMAYDIIHNNVIDYFHGLNDINRKVLTCVGDPAVRMVEDPLRIIRAIRFSISLGYDIDHKTLKAMKDKRNLISNISKERITDEFRKLFKTGKDIRPIFMKVPSIIAEIIPEMVNCIDFNQNNRYHIHNVYEHILYVVDYCKTTDFEIKMAALLHDIAKPEAYVEDELGRGHFYGHPKLSHAKAKEVLSKRFRVTTAEEKNILMLVLYHDLDVVSTTRSVKKLINNVGEDLVEKWFILKQADRDDHIYPDDRYNMDIPRLKEIHKEIIEQEQCFSKKDLAVNGYEIMRLLGIKQGKAVGIVLDQLFDEVLDEKLDNDKNTLFSRAKQIYKEVCK